jgi:hypothetical protein
MERASCRFGDGHFGVECLCESEGLIKVLLAEGAEMAEDLTQRVGIVI